MPNLNTMFERDQSTMLASVLNKPSEKMDAITQHHYENLANGSQVNNEDGTVSTVYTIQVDIEGVPTLIPTVWDCQILNEKDAVRRAKSSGVKWPTGSSHSELIKFDQGIHKNMKDISAKEAQKILDGSN
jgi:hypothetical protein